MPHRGGLRRALARCSPGLGTGPAQGSWSTSASDPSCVAHRLRACGSCGRGAPSRGTSCSGGWPGRLGLCLRLDLALQLLLLPAVALAPALGALALPLLLLLLVALAFALVSEAVLALAFALAVKRFQRRTLWSSGTNSSGTSEPRPAATPSQKADTSQEGAAVAIQSFQSSLLA